MKNLRELVLEKLVIRNADKNAVSEDTTTYFKNGDVLSDVHVSGNDITIDMPPYESTPDNEIVPSKKSKSIKVPNVKFYVFKDPYRKNILHINHVKDFINNFGSLFFDYEDFDPKRIVFSSNSLKDCVRYLFAQNGIDIDEYDDFEDLRGNRLANTYDNVDVLVDFLNGDEDEENFEMDFFANSVKEMVEEFNDIS